MNNDDPQHSTTFVRDVHRDETRLEWAVRFYTAARNSGRVFRTSDGNLLVTHKSGPPSRVLGRDQFDGILSEIVDVVNLVRDRDGGSQREVTTSLSIPELNKLFHSSARDVLPEVRAVVHDPVLVPQDDRGYVCLAPGYNASTGYYYYVSPGSAPIPPRDSLEHLTKCFSAVPFEHKGYFHNLVGWLAAGVILDPRLDPPLLVVTGNQQGIGKSSVVQAAGAILTGDVPAPITPTGSEFMKQVGAHFAENKRLLFLDNIVVRGSGAYDNSALSSLVTSGFTKRIRLLGHSRQISASGVLIAASLNDAKLSADLSTRSLPVILQCWEPRLMHPYVKHYAQDHRDELYGELLGLVLRHKRDPQGDDHHPQFRFRFWLQCCRPAVEGELGEMMISQASALDEITQELFALGLDADTPKMFGPSAEFTVPELVNKIQYNQGTYPALNAKASRHPSVKALYAIFGRMIRSRLNRPFSADGSTYVTFTEVATPTDAPTTYKVTVSETNA